MKTVDDMFPPFELRDQNGSTAQGSDLLGHWAIFYCCPNNMASGCSQEALS